MRFLLQFRGLHNDLRLAELHAVLSLVRNVPESTLKSHVNLQPAYSNLTGLKVASNPSKGHAGSVLYGEIFYYADLKSEAEAILIAQRAVLLRAIYKPIGHGFDYDTCSASIEKINDHTLDVVRDVTKNPSFRCYVEAFGKSYSINEQLHRIHKFTKLLTTFPGKVKMKNPDYEFWILEDAFPSKGHGKKLSNEQPRQILLGLKIANGQGHLNSKYTLKKRNYIGPTSMDAELSFIMSNMARVKQGHLVNDPFCGTCSILIASSVMGATCIASDINILSLNGKGSNENITSNFKQYDLNQPIGILRSDILNHAIRKSSTGWFDAVICDPPYGIKEGTRSFRKDEINETVDVKNHFQGTKRVRFQDFLYGILKYAADVLVENGRLVYWLPTTNEYVDEDVPLHPALEIVHNNEQPLTIRMSRRLITMRRVSKEEQRNRQLIEDDKRLEKNFRIPAHHDLARKLLRQPERGEDRLSDGIS